MEGPKETEATSSSDKKVEVTPEEFARIKAGLIDNSRPVAARHRDLFTLMNIAGNDSIDAMAEAMRTANSALLRHEIAYALGQMQNTHAVPYLNAALEDASENSMVRHEAGEALAAIGLESSLPLLEKYASDPVPEVAETCRLAVDTILYRKKHPQTVSSEAFESVDPAPPYATTDIPKLKEILLNKEKPMFKRYRALFALRERHNAAAVQALCAGFSDDSALLRHEIAYVLGQMQHPASVECLTALLHKKDEHPMVRHEAAEALGSIIGESTTPLLKEFLHDEEPVVSESCLVALDLSEFMASGELQYANSLAVQREGKQ